jgi:biotin/methionine sulfoxide reductase
VTALRAPLELSLESPGTSWSSIASNARLIVMFGELPLRNTQITVGGMGEQPASSR